MSSCRRMVWSAGPPPKTRVKTQHPRPVLQSALPHVPGVTARSKATAHRLFPLVRMDGVHANKGKALSLRLGQGSLASPKVSMLGTSASSSRASPKGTGRTCMRWHSWNLGANLHKAESLSGCISSAARPAVLAGVHETAAARGFLQHGHAGAINRKDASTRLLLLHAGSPCAA